MKTITMNLFMSLCLFLLFFMIYTPASAQDEMQKPWEDGTVWSVDYIKTKDGYTRDYLNNLSEGWVKQMKAAKETGLILDYKILIGQPYGEGDWDMMLLIEYENYAALDRDDEWEALSKKVFQDTEGQRQEAAIARNDIRTLKGGKMVRELNFK